MYKINNLGEELEVKKDIFLLHNHFSKFTETLYNQEFITETIVKLFSNIFLKDIQDFYSKNGISRSNWTHHTANSFLRTCQTLRFLCEFEVENRHDGAVRDLDGNVYLSAEWEFETNSIFKDKGEIEKLYLTTKKHKNSDSLLFTYKVDSDFIQFCDKVYSKWNSLLQTDETNRLFLLTALLNKDENGKSVCGIRTVVIGKNFIDIWEDCE